MNRRFVSLSRGLELVVGVVVVGQTLVTQHRLGVVPDHGPAREHAAGLPGRQRGHVEHEPGQQEIEQIQTLHSAAPGPVLVLGFLDVAPVRVVGAGVHSVHHHVAPPRLVQLCLQQPGTTTNNINTK